MTIDTINNLDDFIKFGNEAFGVELTIKKSDNPDTYEKLFETTKNDFAIDCISRQQAIDAFPDLLPNIGYNKKAITEILQEVPPVTSQEPRKGKWTKISNTVPCMNCPICGSTFTLIQGGDKMHYCPNCGADMREVEE